MSQLKKSRLTPFLPEQIEVTGWFRRQLEVQAAGLSGNLHLIWRDVRDSAWIGGDAEGWERVPYWLDGFIPLAYLLRDQDKIAVCKKYITAILANQQEDGWICPTKTQNERKDYDLWAVFLIAKVLTVYADCAGDQSIEGVLHKLLKNLHTHMQSNPLKRWGKYRWFECLIPIFWLFERRAEGWLLELAELLHKQGFDYAALLQRTDMRKRRLRHYWNFRYHVVNDAMAIKSLALYSRVRSGGEDFAGRFVQALFRHHGMPNGHFSGDECLNGKKISAGTELCGVVEAMYSYENLIAATADPCWADLLETLCFNALPATFTADMWAHQYDQMSNQPFAARIPLRKLPFTSNFSEANMYGLEPNFGCCTANLSQGFPKYALSQFYRDDEAIYIYTLTPARLNATFNGQPLSIEIVTDYPFKDKIALKINAERCFGLKLRVRIPSFFDAATVDGNPVQVGQMHEICADIKGEKVVIIDLAASCRLHNDGGYYLKRGALLFCVDIKTRATRREYTKNNVERKFPYCDYEMFPESKWNYAYCTDTKFDVKMRDIPTYPFSGDNAAISVFGNLKEIKWEPKHNYVKDYPKRIEVIGEDCVELKPYGCTDLRMTLLPKIEFDNMTAEDEK